MLECKTFDILFLSLEFQICISVPLKHVKLIVFENYNECKTKHLFLIKIINTIWFKKSNMEEKEHWWRWSITGDPKEEDPICKDSKNTLSLRTLKRILSMRNLHSTFITVKPKDNPINKDSQEPQGPQWLLHCKLTVFGLLPFWFHVRVHTRTMPLKILHN